jgi:predicted enzyme related to lactoylglutathione lyase
MPREKSAVANLHGRFVWYELATTDREAAIAFYTKVMGWGAWDASAPGRPYVLFSAGPVSAGGLMDLPADARERGVKPSWVGYVGVDDVDAAVGQLKRRGGAVHVPPTDVAGISRFAIVADPQTARLGLFKWLNPAQAPSAAPGAPGRVGWHELLAADREAAFDFYGELFGWKKGDADVGATGPYQLFGAGGQTLGAILTKPAITPEPFWLYYFTVGDLDAATKRVTAGGGRVVHGPLEVPGGRWIAQCTDPQGALFALEGQRRPAPVGYFEAKTEDR